MSQEYEKFEHHGLTVRILQDEHQQESPAEYDLAWKLYSFSRNHGTFKDPADLGFADPMDVGLRKKLEVGTAFVLGYFEHGRGIWHISGDIPMGTAGDYRWDGVNVAGLLLWEHDPKEMGAKTKKARQKDAEGFLETYNSWCNGDIYGYVVEDRDGEELDSCWGYIGDMDYCQDQAKIAAEHHAKEAKPITASRVLDLLHTLLQRAKEEPIISTVSLVGGDGQGEIILRTDDGKKKQAWVIRAKDIKETKEVAQAPQSP